MDDVQGTGRYRRWRQIRRRPSWDQRLLERGEDPDPRFSLANERTFLAWVRTALGMIAAGVGVDALVTDVPDWSRRTMSILLVLLGGVTAVAAFQRWYRSEEAMRHGQTLPSNRLAPVITVGIAAGAVLATLLILGR